MTHIVICVTILLYVYTYGVQKYRHASLKPPYCQIVFKLGDVYIGTVEIYIYEIFAIPVVDDSLTSAVV